MRDGVIALTEDGALEEDVDDVVFGLERDWPFYEGVAGNTRQQVLGFAVRTVAAQLGKTVE